MTQSSAEAHEPAIPLFLSQGGEMGQRIREFDWSRTSLKTIDTWPQSLQSALSICLNSNFPIAIYWGRELVLLYNDAWSPIPGNKHPWALGHPAREVWPDIWDAIEPQFQKAFSGEPGGSKDALLPMQRHGYIEECYFDFTFTPIYGEGGKVDGVFNAVIETTYRIISERRTAFLKNLTLNIGLSQSIRQLYNNAMRFVAGFSKDIPFALLYSYENGEAEIVASSIDETIVDSAKRMWPFKEIATAGTSFYIENLSEYLVQVPHDYWNQAPTEAVVVPLINSNGLTKGFIICALSSRRRFDEEYKLFIEGVANAITNVSNNIAALEEERKRSEALAEIDKAKTIFFSNISHEFRTPLTLILGSLEEILRNQETDPTDREAMEIMHRNALRLLRLVNNLLDFSRIEAGKEKAQYQLTNIAQFTNDVTSNFRSVIENAGLDFQVTTNKIVQPVFIDKLMWEKIVLNLLSNAFKYTLKGTIHLSLAAENNDVILQVKDSGVGIPAEELPKMFQRFHRVQGVSGRTYEGTGIGLSLVRELVHLHGGVITVNSTLGSGSEFTVRIPTGKAHLPVEKVLTDEADFKAALSETFVEEAFALLEWPFSTNGNGEPQIPPSSQTVLIVDDNADIRAYLRKLLQEHYHVVTANNGMDGLQKINEIIPTLVVSDVMMPVMDGIQLVKEIKQNPATSNIPVILLSARAGEEAKVEGYDIGADDYLVKPFSAKELLARVQSQIKLKQSRENALKNLYSVFDDVPFAVAVLKGEDLILEFINKYNLSIWQRTKEEVLGKPLYKIFPGNRQAVEAVHRQVYETGKRFTAREIPVEVLTDGKLQMRWFNTVIDPLRNENGQVIGQLASTIEVTEQVLALKKVEESQQDLQNLFKQAPAAIAVVEGPEHRYIMANVLYQQLFGRHHDQLIGKTIREVFPEAQNQGIFEIFGNVYRTGKPYVATEFPAGFNKPNDNEPYLGYYNFVVQPIKNANDKVKSILIHAFEITEQVQARKQLEESEQRFRTLAETLPQMVWMRNSEGRIEFASKNWEEYSGIKNISEAWKEMTHPQDWEPIMTVWQNAVKARIGFQYEVRLKNKAGEYRWHYAVGEPVKNESGEVVKYIGALTDIHIQKTFAEKLEKDVAERTTELKAKNEDLQKTQSFLQQLIDSSVEYITVLDKDLKFVTVNKRYEDTMGITRRELHGRHLFEVTPKAEGSLQHESILRALQGETVYLDKRQAIARAGMYVDTYFIPLRTNNVVDGIIIMARDVTDIVQSEKLLEQTNYELQRSNEDLQKFAHVASHDLKEPVRKVKIFSGLLADELKDKLNEKSKLYLSKVQSATNRISTMIDGVLAYSTINASAQHAEQVDLNQVIRNIENDLEIPIKDTGTNIYHKNLPVVEGAAVLLYQLFYNLINNSIKFAKDNVQPQISIVPEILSKEGYDWTQIKVEDNSIGFEQDYAEDIFHTFSRLHSRDKYEGTGLGLALCKKIVERHGGNIKAESTPGEGATFTILLPLKQRVAVI